MLHVIYGRNKYFLLKFGHTLYGFKSNKSKKKRDFSDFLPVRD